MKRNVIAPALILLAVLATLAVLPQCVRSAEKPQVRPAAVAGGFYPADKVALEKMIDGLLAQATVPAIDGKIMAVVAPHAGYPYSGPVAAYSYAALKRHKWQRVVVIAPSHYEGFPFASVYNGDAYATPLGTIPVDKEFAEKLAQSDRHIKLSTQGHIASGPQGEHSLEVELPFLQRVLGDFKLVPIIMGDQDYTIERALGVALAKLAQGTDTLIVASSDLSHYHPYADAVKLDHKTLGAIKDWDYFTASRNFQARTWEACGGGPIVAAMIAVERMGANQAVLLKYANSGDTTGDKSQGVVGYSAWAFVQSPTVDAKPARFTLGGKEKDELLKVARTSVQTAVKDRKLYDAPEPKLSALLDDRGAFVTLKENGELRGCIGYTGAIKPLYQTVRDVAAFAAVRDTRFPPVSASELPKLEYEISVLSRLRHVTDVKQIKIGQHGLLLRHGEYEGIFLPQVPVEQHWDRTTYLQELCGKAGIADRNCWKSPDTDLFMFEALVFGEHQLSTNDALPPAQQNPADQSPRDSRQPPEPHF
jgi:hypothetical protein